VPVPQDHQVVTITVVIPFTGANTLNYSTTHPIQWRRSDWKQDDLTLLTPKTIHVLPQCGSFYLNGQQPTLYRGTSYTFSINNSD
jgi:hypothetical protein